MLEVVIGFCFAIVFFVLAWILEWIAGWIMVRNYYWHDFKRRRGLKNGKD